MEYVFFVFIFLSCGLGYKFLDLHRIGGTLVYSDFFIGLMIIFLLISNRKKLTLVRKTTILAVFVLLFELLIGLASEYEIQYIVRDIKMWLYFFIPYWTTKYISLKKKDSANKLIVYAVFISILATLFQCWHDFFVNGLNNIDRGSINRDFTIGLTFYCASFLILIVWANRDAIVDKIGIFSYVAIQIIGVASVIVSYTRTNWILCIMSFTTLMIVMKGKKMNNKSGLKSFTTFSIFIGVLLIGWWYFVSYYPDFINTILSRFLSIGDKQIGNNVNTFQHRVDYTMNTLVKFKSPKILIGWGFGDTQSGHDGEIVWNCENSVLYYCWKYGVVAATFLFVSVVNKTLKMIRSNNPAKIASGVFLTWFFIIGSWSGNMNYYYFLSFIAILLAFNRYDLLWNVKMQERNYEKTDNTFKFYI